MKLSVRVTGQYPELRTDFSDQFREVAQILMRAIKLNFSMRGARQPSQRFAVVRSGLAASFPWRQIQRPKGRPPLQGRTGRFANATRVEWAKNSATARMVSPFSDTKAKGVIPWVHQKGSAARNIPARPFMYLTKEDEASIAKALMRDIIIKHNLK